MTTTSRYGPLRRALINRDAQLLIETVRERCDVDVFDPNSCWMWRGSTVGAGYGFVGRGQTRAFVHRLVAFAADDFPGDLKTFPAVHHICGVRSCTNPGHLVKATALMNAIEARARGALLGRIKDLQNALRDANPNHPLLHDGWATSSTPLPPHLNTGVSYETPGERVKRHRRRQEWEQRLRSRQQQRFAQVLAYQKLVRSGVPSKVALERVGMTRSTASDWAIRMREWMADGEL